MKWVEMPIEWEKTVNYNHACMPTDKPNILSDMFCYISALLVLLLLFIVNKTSDLKQY